MLGCIKKCPLCTHDNIFSFLRGIEVHRSVMGDFLDENIGPFKKTVIIITGCFSYLPLPHVVEVFVLVPNLLEVLIQ